MDIGTEITLYIDEKISHDIQPKEIIDYICDTMKDISYSILIKDEINKNEKLLEAKKLRKHITNDDLLFVPFLDTGKIGENISLEQTIRTNDFIENYSCGLLIDITGNNQIGAVLNSGIKLYDTDVDDIWSMLLNSDSRMVQYLNNFFLFNFPSNYLNIDVSREKITSLNTAVIGNDFKIKLISEILRQITEYISLCKTNETKNKAINLHILMMALVRLCKHNSELSRLSSSLMSMRYGLFIRFNGSSIDLIVSRISNKPVDALAYIQNNYSKVDESFEKFIYSSIKYNQMPFSLQTEYLHKIFPEMQELLGRHGGLILNDNLNDYYTYRYSHRERTPVQMFQYLQKKLKSKDDKMVYAFLLLEAYLLKKRDIRPTVSIMENILWIFLEQNTVSMIENGECAVSIRQEDIKKVIKRLN